MSDIPDDIMKTADAVASQVGAIWDIDPIAQAILSERNRCKTIADNEARYATGCNPAMVAKRIADAISKGDRV